MSFLKTLYKINKEATKLRYKENPLRAGLTDIASTGALIGGGALLLNKKDNNDKDHEILWSVFVGEPKGKDYEAFLNASISEKEQILKSVASDTDDALWRSKEWMRISGNPKAEEDYIQSAAAMVNDKKLSKVEIENDLSSFNNDELFELANYYKYPQGYRELDSLRSREYSNRIQNEILKRQNPFTQGLPSGDTMGTEDFR
tara:strand:- start:15 stop:620 length:606 start_codon:yes stop_codon:yes gene_type:complete